VGLHEDIWPLLRTDAKSQCGLNHELKDFLELALNLGDAVISDEDNNRLEQCAVQDLLERRVGFLVGLPRRAQQLEGIIEGSHGVIKLGDGLALPFLDLACLGLDALLFFLEHFD
jgi:hypothetical protein